MLMFGALSVNAQNQTPENRGLFGRGENADRQVSGIRGIGINIGGNSENGITNSGIGEPEAPLGSGIIMLVAAGLGYAALKKKEDEQ